jgi:transposase, IS5 family
MSKPMRGSRQPDLFARSKSPTIAVPANHRLVELTDVIDWTELEVRTQKIRAQKLKNAAGRPPHLRPLLGAMVLRATRYVTYRVLEDQIRYYAPARYLCALTETDWSPDHNTLYDFIELMGEEGTRLINEYVVGWAVEEKLADPKVLVADLTAQEAQIPYPNEMGLLSSFLKSIAQASKKAGGALKQFVSQAGNSFAEGKKKLRQFRLFAKDKSKQQKDKMTQQMVSLVENIQGQLRKALAAASTSKDRLTKYAKAAHTKVEQLHETMKQLTPQIRYWLTTGWVASGKIISVHIPELYSVVRGKVGKKVEFGLSWGIRRLRGGFLLATLATGRKDLPDAKFCVSAVDEHIALFGKPPQSYAYDRGGWSDDNVAAIKRRGVKNVGLAPRGKAAWRVVGKMKEKLVNERAQVEGGIGTIKHQKYGFNKPAARSARMMGTCGQLAVLGFNLNKMVRELAARRDVVLVG